MWAGAHAFLEGSGCACLCLYLMLFKHIRWACACRQSQEAGLRVRCGQVGDMLAPLWALANGLQAVMGTLHSVFSTSSVDGRQGMMTLKQLVSMRTAAIRTASCDSYAFIILLSSHHLQMSWVAQHLPRMDRHLLRYMCVTLAHIAEGATCVTAQVSMAGSLTQKA